MVGIRTLYLVVYSPELYLLDHTIAMVLDDSLDIDTQNEPIYLIFNLFYCVIDLYNLPYHPPPLLAGLYLRYEFYRGYLPLTSEKIMKNPSLISEEPPRRKPKANST